MTNSLQSPALALGAGGQLGRAFRALGVKGVDRQDADLSNIPSLLALLEREKPHTIFNASAYTKVDAAETNRQEAFAVNADAVEAIAQWCAGAGAALVHFSTDYVFNGEGSLPWREEDVPAPLNVYGESKLEGERRIAESGAKHLIFRTSWVYDAHGSNFYNTMRRLMREREALSVVADQIGAPTYAPHLAAVALLAVAGDFPSGLYHLCHGGETSWYGFAQAIHARISAREALRVERIDAIASSDYPTPAKRPLNSRLDCSKAKRVLGVELPSWETGLDACVKESYAG